jgi:hypothetical protein
MLLSSVFLFALLKSRSRSRLGAGLGFETRVDAAIYRPVLKTKVGSQSSEHGVSATGKHHPSLSCYGVKRYVWFLRDPDSMEQDRKLPCDCDDGLALSLLATSSRQMQSLLSKCGVSSVRSQNVVRALDQ